MILILLYSRMTLSFLSLLAAEAFGLLAIMFSSLVVDRNNLILARTGDKYARLETNETICDMQYAVKKFAFRCDTVQVVLNIGHGLASSSVMFRYNVRGVAA